MYTDCIHIHIYTHACIYIYILHIPTYIYTLMYVRTDTHRITNIQLFLIHHYSTSHNIYHVYVCIFIYIYIIHSYIHMHMYNYTYIYTT